MPSRRLGLWSVPLGGLLAVLGAFPVAVLVALVYRFPIPFVGYCSGPEAILPSFYAVAMYGVFLGGFIPLAVLGALGGAIAYWSDGQNGKGSLRITLALALLVDLLGTLTLAVLDKIIGPW